MSAAVVESGKDILKITILTTCCSFLQIIRNHQKHVMFVLKCIFLFSAEFFAKEHDDPPIINSKDMSVTKGNSVWSLIGSILFFVQTFL